MPVARELVLDYIIERKRMDDLCGSIIDGRFREQKVLLNCDNLFRSAQICSFEPLLILTQTWRRQKELLMSFHSFFFLTPKKRFSFRKACKYI